MFGHPVDRLVEFRHALAEIRGADVPGVFCVVQNRVARTPAERVAVREPLVVEQVGVDPVDHPHLALSVIGGAVQALHQRLARPGDRLFAHLKNSRDGDKLFDATDNGIDHFPVHRVGDQEVVPGPEELEDRERGERVVEYVRGLSADDRVEGGRFEARWTLDADADVFGNDRRVIASAVGDDVAAAVEALPEPYRQVLVLKLRHDKSPAEIAVLLDVPPATVRHGAFVEKGAILMPSYVNIGAYVDESTMVDTWATVGSCAQIGRNVHLSGGVGIGGVLEPVQAGPTIIEDDCFIGARSEVVEGVVVGTVSPVACEEQIAIKLVRVVEEES